jgi:hypothetical protein
MTVRALMEQLNQMPPDAQVIVYDEGHPEPASVVELVLGKDKAGQDIGGVLIRTGEPSA